MATATQYNIRFIKIEVISKSISSPPFIDEGKVLTFNFNFIVDIKTNPLLKVLIVLTDISILEPPNVDPVAVFKTACVFEIEDFENIVEKRGENLYHVPQDLEIILKSAGISTTRGIMYSELRGTYLSNAIFPLIDIGTIVKRQAEELERSSS